MPPVTEIRHRSHPKCTLKLESSSKPYICDGCQELGFGVCYRCRKCKFYIHKECAILPLSSTYHHLFEKCRFEFYWNSPVGDCTVCDACGKDIKGFVYHCSKKRLDMHPPCAKLPLTLIGKDVKLDLKNKASLPCQKCRIKSSSKGGPKGWSYISTRGRYCLHVACVKEMFYEAWEKGYFSVLGHCINKNNLALPSTIPSTSRGIAKYRGGISSSQKRVANTSMKEREESKPSRGHTHESSLSRRRDRGTSKVKGYRGRSSSLGPSQGTNGSYSSLYTRRRNRESSLSRSKDRGTSRVEVCRGRSSSRGLSSGTHRSYSSSCTRRSRESSLSCSRDRGTRRSSSQGRVPCTTGKEIMRSRRERKSLTKWKIGRSVLGIILSAICGEPITFSASCIDFLVQTISWFTS